VQVIIAGDSCAKTAVFDGQGRDSKGKDAKKDPSVSIMLVVCVYVSVLFHTLSCKA
jgi:hypothetical protein